jgi:hypothetical protein
VPGSESAPSTNNRQPSAIASIRQIAKYEKFLIVASVTSYMRFISGNQTRPLAVELPGDGAVIVQQRFQPVLNPTVVLGSIIS